MNAPAAPDPHPASAPVSAPAPALSSDAVPAPPAEPAGTSSGALPDDLSPYLDGTRLYGDDFADAAIAAWYADEAEAYASLGAGERGRYRYRYHAWNRLHGFDHLDPERRFARVLAFGSAHGDELRPVLGRSDAVVMVDPSAAFARDTLDGVPVRYVVPAPSGDLALGSASVDLATCFGVLHHIPNVSHVLGEIARTLRPGATLLLREPIVSMGDWRAPRPGLTRRERGIPHALLLRACRAAGLVVRRAALCGFAPTPRLLGRLVDGDVYNDARACRIDAALCRLFAWNARYHARSAFGKVRPTCAFLVLEKR